MKTKMRRFFSSKDVLDELELAESLGENEATFYVSVDGIGEWLFEEIDDLPDDVYLVRNLKAPVEVLEEKMSYQVTVKGRKLFVSKKLYNLQFVLKVLKEKLFSDVLYKNDFVVGFVFTFSRLKRKRRENRAKKSKTKTAVAKPR